jgi:hypothetical protein
MKQFSVFFCILFSSSLFSQTGFYLHPSIEYKFDINTNFQINITTIQNYTIHLTPKNITPETIVFAGFQIGYRGKNTFFETGWGQDKFSSGITISATAYDLDKHKYYTKVRKDYGGATFNKIPLRFGIRLFGNDSVATNKKNKWQAFMFGSLDVFIPVSSDKEKKDVFITNQQGDAINYQFKSFSMLGIALKTTIGLMLKRKMIKGRNINFSLSYLPSYNAGIFSSGTGNTLIFTNYDKTKYLLGNFSDGAGFYLGISSDLFIKNWFHKKQNVAYYKK